MATYADLYDEPDAGPPEGELVAAVAPAEAAALVGAGAAGGAMNPRGPDSRAGPLGPDAYRQKC